jgi:hypothetical protein
LFNEREQSETFRKEGKERKDWAAREQNYLDCNQLSCFQIFTQITHAVVSFAQHSNRIVSLGPILENRKERERERKKKDF